MPTAHEDNGGIQVFSRTQTAEQIQAALGDGFQDFTSETYSTAPAAPAVDPNAPPAEPVAAEPVAAVELAKPPRPGKRERQLAKANQTIEEMRREMAELKGMVTGLSTVQRPPAPVATPAPVAAAPAPEVTEEPVTEPAVEVKARPKREDFFEATDPDVAYEDAVADWKYESRQAQERQRETAAAADRAKRERETVQQNVQNRWNEELTAVKTQFKDFDEVLNKPHFDADKKPLQIMSPILSDAIRSRLSGPRILYWLATHPEEANKIAIKTTLGKDAEPWAIEEARDTIRDEFKRIEQDMKDNPPVAAAAQPAGAAAQTDESDDEDDDLDDDETDPNIPVAADPQAGKQVAQPQAPGTVDTKPAQPTAPAVTAKPEPIGRVGNRSAQVNRNILATPPEVLKNLPPSDYRQRRALEGSTAARG